MAKILLQNAIEDLKFEDLPAEWNSFDLKSFSKNKTLWDYQQSAVENAIKVLWKYFEDFADYQKGEGLEVNQGRKEKFFNWYKDNGLEENHDIKLDKRKRKIYNLLTEYYSQEDNKISYEYFINRMCFWMATASGKSLVIIKLIQILKKLIDIGEIPPHDIMFLTFRDDLIEQLKKHVDEFNESNYELKDKIILKELKDYPEVKRQQTLSGFTVFYYRSDNLSDEQKEKIIDFRNYDNNGKWYIFLDEAHKGDKEDSKRQHIYSILSRNGFLFNSSATFTDSRDIITCAFEFNLSSFINSGYGKHIGILKQEIRAFRDNEDYSGEEKQKIILKSLIILTYAKKFYGSITRIKQGLYHKPLLLTLVNSVNTENADLKLFFREIEKIGKGEVTPEVFNSARDELWDELKQEHEFMFEKDIKIKTDKEVFYSIELRDVLKNIYNSDSPGEIEISFRPSDKKQVAFKLTTSDKHFALSKTGDIPNWLKAELSRFNINHQFEQEGFFERINRDESHINILMGSRAFYEGWDSNRPNVINFINIGMGQDTKKFILQSVGRGVRIEPIKDKRKRLLQVYNSKEIDEDLFDKIKNKVLPVETLFIFGTNRNALVSVIQELEKEKKEEEHQLSLFVNEKVKEHELLIPVYQLADHPLIENRELVKFEISQRELEILKGYAEYISDDRIFLMLYNTTPAKIKILNNSLSSPDNYKYGEKNFRNIDLLTQRIFDYFSVVPEEFKELKELEGEIKHFENIKVYLRDINEIQKKIEKVKNYKDYESRKKELEKQFREGEISFEELEGEIKSASSTEDFEYDHKKIIIKYLANHYYIPLILSDDEKVDYIKHIIKTQSEVKFINDLENYLAKSDNKFKEFDWWLFSKLDESLDKVYIPYYNSNGNKISPFYPDFVFWLKKDNDYSIVFVDPKGTAYSDWADKVNGYKGIFEENENIRVFDYNGFRVKIRLLLRTKDATTTKQRFPEHSKYWFDNIEKMLNS